VQANPCKPTRIGYARFLVRCYIQRPGIKMAEESPLVRQWILLRTLCARSYGATVKEMVDEMSVSDKTIRRDLETFQKAGFPLQETIGDHGQKRWRIDPSKTQPGLTFTFDEAVGASLARRSCPSAAIQPCSRGRIRRWLGGSRKQGLAWVRRKGCRRTSIDGSRIRGRGICRQWVRVGMSGGEGKGLFGRRELWRSGARIGKLWSGKADGGHSRQVCRQQFVHSGFDVVSIIRCLVSSDKLLVCGKPV